MLEESPTTPGEPGAAGGLPSSRAISRRAATRWNATFRVLGFGLVLVRNIALVPLFAKYIGQHEYSVWLASGGVLAQLGTLDFGLMGVLQQQTAVAYGAGDRTRLAAIAGTGLATMFAICGLLCGVGGLIGLLLPLVLHTGSEVGGRLSLAFLIASGGVAAQLAVYALGNVLNALQRPIAVGISRNVADVASIGLTLTLLFNGAGFFALAWGLVARATLDAFIVAITFLRVWRGQLRLPLRFERREAVGLFKLSGIQFVAQLAGRTKYALDPILMGAFLGVEVAGAFALTTRAHETIRSFVAQFAGAVTPSMGHLFGEGRIQRFRELSLTLFRLNAVVAALGMAAVVAFNQQFVTLWVGSHWYAGDAVTVAAAIWGMLSLTGTVSYDQLYAMGEYARTCRLVLLEGGLRLVLGVPGLLLFGAWALPAVSAVTQALVMNGMMTKLLFEKLDGRGATRPPVNRFWMEHAIGPFLLAGLCAWLGLGGESWPAFIGAACVFMAIVAAWSLGVDPALRRMVVQRRIA